MTQKRVAILGSTGSIGTQALSVIQQQKEHFTIELLTANDNADLLIEQARLFNPNSVVVCNKDKYEKVKSALADLPIKVYCGIKAIEQEVQSSNIDIVLTAMVGQAGLMPTIKAIEAGKNIALANKETLVVAGELITTLAKQKGVNIYPVDSEHSAIFQCLVGEWHNPVEKIILTASGGPFRGKKLQELKDAKKEQALKHPNWNMGQKITIDSATLMNKGLEVIEAKWLFGLRPQQIEVIIHPQSIIHSMVQFTDGSVKAQMGLPDMKLPILYALSYPDRLNNTFKRFSFTDYPSLTFEKPDMQTFHCLTLAFEALRKGGNIPCVMNAANEVAVAEFLADKISFTDIPAIIEYVMLEADYVEHPSLEDYLESDKEARQLAVEWKNRTTLNV